jgi:hypothetical protein
MVAAHASRGLKAKKIEGRGALSKEEPILFLQGSWDSQCPQGPLFAPELNFIAMSVNSLYMISQAVLSLITRNETFHSLVSVRTEFGKISLLLYVPGQET